MGHHLQEGHYFVIVFSGGAVRTGRPKSEVAKYRAEVKGAIALAVRTHTYLEVAIVPRGGG